VKFRHNIIRQVSALYAAED